VSGRPDRRLLKRLELAAHIAALKADLAAGQAAAARRRQEQADQELRDCLARIDAPSSQLQLLVAGVAAGAIVPLGRASAEAGSAAALAVREAAIARARRDALEARVRTVRIAIERAEAEAVLFESLLRPDASGRQLQES
jgi:hypothetical protein